MSLDTSDVQSAIRKIESDMRRLQADVEQLRRTVDASEVSGMGLPQDAPTDLGLNLPAEIVVKQPGEIAQYLRTRPTLTRIVSDMAIALVEEFRGERSEIELAVYQDPEIDDHYLIYYVRVPQYDDTFAPRLHGVWARVDSRCSPSREWIQVSTDYQPIARR
jgi:hypothetical protein